MPIDPTKPVDGVPAEKADLRASLQAAKDGVEGAHAISTDGTAITIDETDFGDSMDFLQIHDSSSAVNLTLGTGVATKKTFHVVQKGSGVVNVQATNLLTGAVSTTTQYDSLVFRSLGSNQWVRIQTA